MNIDSLPNDILRLILNCFHLQKQLLFRRVCRRWDELIQQFCSERQSLKLFRDYRTLENYSYDLVNYNLVSDVHFKLKEFGTGEDDDLVAVIHPWRIYPIHYISIGRLFTNVKHLLVYNFSLMNHFDVPLLLSYWPNLQSLIMFGMPVPNEWPRLWSAVNSLKSLKQLHLFNVLECHQVPTAEDGKTMAVLSKMKHFSLTGEYYAFSNKSTNPDGVIGILKYLGAGLTHLRCASAEFAHLFLDDSLLKKFTSVTHLTVDNPEIFLKRPFMCDENMWSISFICEKFIWLKSLNITDMHQVCFFRLVRELAPLKHLDEFKCYLDLKCLKRFRQNVMPTLCSMRTLHLHIFLPLEKEPKELKFNEKNTNKVDLKRLIAAIPLIFPELKFLDLICSTEDSQFLLGYISILFSNLPSLSISINPIWYRTRQLLNKRHKKLFDARRGKVN